MARATRCVAALPLGPRMGDDPAGGGENRCVGRRMRAHGGRAERGAAATFVLRDKVLGTGQRRMGDAMHALLLMPH